KLLEHRHTENVLALNEAFDLLFMEVQRTYDAEKVRLGAMDFDDLITKTGGLLQSDQAWIMHKLDGGFDHLLIDEAQDTSLSQWAIVKALTAHFFETPSNNNLPRTLFVVGDGKQSIYSFQGADPRMYLAVKEHFEALLRTNDITLHTIPLTTCYRCAPEILALVNSVCTIESIAPSLLHDDVITHIPHRLSHQGSVVAWPLVSADINEVESDDDDSISHEETSYKTENPGWTLYSTPLLLPSPEEELAKNIAAQIHGLLTQGDILPSTNQPVEAKDIYILLKRRGKLMALIGSTLTQLGIANTCQDQSAFLEHLYIQDFLAFLTFLDCPYDDLNLACLLKSPVFGMGEEDLLALCHSRRQPLWEALQQSFKHKDHTHFLNHYIALSKTGDIYTLAHTYLHTTFARNQSIFYSEVPILMESLMDLTLSAATSGIMTVFDLCQHIREQAPLLKKQIQGNGVRIMTIHGSKGLQAPIVILGDAGERVISTYDKILFTDSFHLLRQDYQTLQSIKDLEKSTLNAENHRLLYVALTRAQDRLYITGIDRGVEESWYNILAPHVEKADNVPHVVPLMIERESVDNSEPSPIPYISSQRSVERPKKEAERGIHIHKLLELLPALSPGSELTHPVFKHLNKDEIASLQTFYQEKIRPLLDGMTTFQELSIRAKNGTLLRLDAVAFGTNTIVIIDFKTGAKKNEAASLTKRYIEQINVYAAALHDMYPAHMIEGMLVYTQCHSIMKWTCPLEQVKTLQKS
ncbi:MAG: UvrD-helicase domain-containing protein, partial [Alphaproteobacteria bacterium]|nr:UvrD-helicase domain-containing protein [Alphaproteobacteria bacterium]